MTPYEYPELDETLYRQKLPNGLTVCVVPRKGFTRSLAYFVTDYGSVHTDYRFAGKDYRSPAGVAHYLEHKMFDLPDRDVSAEFARLGASTNAFTRFSKITLSGASSFMPISWSMIPRSFSTLSAVK